MRDILKDHTKIPSESHTARELVQIKLIQAELKKYGLSSILRRKERRNILKIYYDVLSAILEETYSGEAKPTRVQVHSNTSYEKLVRYLKELEKNEMIRKKPLSLTKKGEQFLADYKKLDGYIQNISL